MERLRLGDLKAVTGFLHDLYEVQELSAFQQRLISRLPSVVPCDVVTYCENNFRTGESRGFADPADYFDAASSRVYSRYARESPLIRAYRRGRGSAVKYSDFLTRRQFQRTGLYNEFFRPRGTEFRIAKGLPGPSGLVTAVYLDRSRRDFTERDRTLLNLLRPHFNQSYQNAVIVSGLREEMALIEKGVESANAGLVLLASDNRPRRITPRARRWLEEHFDTDPAVSRSLPDAVTRWLARQNPADAGEVSPPATPLTVEGESSRLVIRLVAHGSQRLLALQRQPRGVAARPPASLGLSPREADVLGWIVQGKTNAETASILGLSPRTVDKHVENIYTKLGVETRLAAAARLREVVSADPD